MRERKFKGKAVNDYPHLKIKRGDWVFGYLADEDVISVKTYMDDYGDLNCVLVQVDPETVCQYTELNDKKKQEIYEGDLVKHSDYPKNIYVVVWEYAGFMLKLIGSDDYLLCADWESELEVVGNIHDNVEMLGMQNV